uniref:Rad60/SUMO-like domain-containing protein n=1 Tax=Panagrolaimus sp. ES5 TaxID=591445 RepID=A0AC34GQV7_9BILA
MSNKVASNCNVSNTFSENTTSSKNNVNVDQDKIKVFAGVDEDKFNNNDADTFAADYITVAILKEGSNESVKWKLLKYICIKSLEIHIVKYFAKIEKDSIKFKNGDGKLLNPLKTSEEQNVKDNDVIIFFPKVKGGLPVGVVKKPNEYGSASNSTPTTDQYSNLDLRRCNKNQSSDFDCTDSGGNISSYKSVKNDADASNVFSHDFKSANGTAWKHDQNQSNVGQIKQLVEKESVEQHKNASKNSSTLSLHILAYENSVEANKNGTDQTHDVAKQHRFMNQKLYTKSLKKDINIPRQQQENMEPEVMQFKASQRLLNPNDTLAARYLEQLQQQPLGGSGGPPLPKVMRMSTEVNQSNVSADEDGEDIIQNNVDLETEVSFV